MQHMKHITEFLESMNRRNKFNKLKPKNYSDNSFNISINVSGYNELNLMVSDLLKASIILLNDDARNSSSVVSVSDINVNTLLEIALQLLPEEEMELLDDLHTIYLETRTA